MDFVVTLVPVPFFALVVLELLAVDELVVDTAKNLVSPCKTVKVG